MDTSGRPSQPEHEYDAFISYSHAVDGKLAPAIQTALRRFGKPWYRRSSVRVFRDQTGLGLTPDLWGDIQRRLERSRCFILLAAPEAARSEWVDKEVQFWRQHRPRDPLLIALTGGKLDWDGKTNDFDWTYTDALPPSLQKAFGHEPLWADLTWARSDKDLSLRKPQFFAEIAKIVAGMRGESLDRVFDEAAVQQRKATRLFHGAVAALVVVVVLAVGAAIVAMRQSGIVEQLNQAEAERVRARQAVEDERRNEAALAEQQREAEAASKTLASQAIAVWPRDKELGTLLAIEAVTKAPTAEAEQALRKALLAPVKPLVLRGHSGPVGTSFSADGNYLLTAGEDRTVRLWDALSGKSLRSFKVAGDPHDSVIGFVSADGSRVLTMSAPSTYALGFWDGSTPLTVYDAQTGRPLSTMTDDSAARADLSQEGTRVITAGWDTLVKIWDATTGKVLFELKDHEHRVTSARFSSDGRRAVTCSYDGTTRVWDVATGASVAVLRDPDELICGDAVFSPDGGRILTLGGTNYEDDDVLQLWDWAHATGTPSAKLEGHEGVINAFAIGPDGKQVATGGTRDHEARIWDAASGKCIHVLSGFEDFINGVAFSPNGKWLVVASGDGTARIFDTLTGQELMSLGTDDYPRTTAAFSADGERVVTGTTNGEVLLYALPMLGSAEQLKTMAASRVTRQLTADERRTYLGEPAAGH